VIPRKIAIGSHSLVLTVASDGVDVTIFYYDRYKIAS
jgi:hypothetical protein